MSSEPTKSIEEVIRSDGRYPPEAFAFLHEGLSRAQSAEGPLAPGERRHVSARQHCMAMRDLAVERWGQLAQAVLAKWNITATIDFGNMVYLLADSGYIKTSEEDSHDDYRNVFSFDEAFAGQDDFELNE